MNCAIIACQTLQDELNLAIQETRCQYPVIWLESKYHISPNSLREKLQSEIDNLKKIDTILFAYGSCGSGLVGLTASTANLIIPKTEDCISMILSQPTKTFERPKKTYFITKGWMDSSSSLLEEYEHTLKRHGEERTKRIFKLMLGHYQYLMLIDTGAYNLDEWKNKAQELAQKVNLELVTKETSIWLLKQLLTGPYDENFCTIKKGETVSLGHFGYQDGRPSQ